MHDVIEFFVQLTWNVHVVCFVYGYACRHKQMAESPAAQAANAATSTTSAIFGFAVRLGLK